MIEPPRVHILGASSARPSLNRDHSSMVVDFGGDLTLVDCSANPIGKILRLGLDPFEVRRVLVTHAHPDHTYGFPSVIYSLMTHPPIRTKPLAIHALDLLSNLWRAYGFGDPDKPLPFDVSFHEIPLRECHLIVEGGNYGIRSTPVVHKDQEVVAFRFDDEQTGKTLTVSADTEPCPALDRLAAGTDLLIMEAGRQGGEDLPGHSTGEEAGETAARAGAERLLLIHVVATNPAMEAELTSAAAKAFGGRVEIAEDMKTYAF